VIATASVSSRPIAMPVVTALGPELFGVRGAFRVNALAPALERQGLRPPDAHFAGVHDRAKLNECLGRLGEDRVEVR
jgi:hypothetical protein